MKEGSRPFIRVEDLYKSYHHHPVLRGVDLQVYSHELTVIIGPSGSGKSTLLRCLNSLETFDAGRISVGDLCLERTFEKKWDERVFYRTAQSLRRTVGMVFQNFNLFPHRTVLENVALAPMVVKGVTRGLAREEAAAMLEKVGLERHLDHYPAQLSGGQQQRAAIARALAMSPQVMLYDEPTSALDPALAEEVLQVMLKLNEEGMTQILVTHKMAFARKAAHKVAYFQDGAIVEMATPEALFTRPSDERTQKFLQAYLNEEEELAPRNAVARKMSVAG